MVKRRLKTGEWGWIGMLAYIILLDSIAWRNQLKGKDDETMSLSWGRWLQCPHSRAATGIVWALITGHLFLSFPIPGQKTLKNVVIRTRQGKLIVVPQEILEELV